MSEADNYVDDMVDSWFKDDPGPSGKKTPKDRNHCSLCGTKNVGWFEFPEGWFLIHEDGTKHLCKTRNKECKHCGTDQLKWHKFEEGWFLIYEDGTKHLCLGSNNQ